MTRLENLPDELLVCILTELSPRDLLACTTLNRRFYDILHGTVNIQYKIALSANHLEDAVRGYSKNVSTRYELLKKYEAGWRDLKWSHHLTIPVDFLASTVYEVSGDLVILGMLESESFPYTTALAYIELPSSYDSSADRRLQWSRLNLGMPIRDFAIDLDRDLLVLIEATIGWDQDVRIHLRTFSQCKPHPEASSPVLRWTVDHIGGLAIHIVGDTLGIFFSCPFPHQENKRLVLWNWVTGVIIGVLVPFINEDWSSFTFLSDRTILLPCNSEGTLDVYLFDPAYVPQEQEHREQSPAEPSPELVASFFLPSREEEANTAAILCRGYPLPHPSFPSSSPSFHRRPKPFQTKYQTGDGIIVLALRMFTVASQKDSTLVVHASTLLEMLQVDALNPIMVPWEAWGPAHTRLLDEPGSSYWICNVHGTKLVTLRLEVDAAGEPYRGLRVLDFNPRAVAKLEQSIQGSCVEAAFHCPRAIRHQNTTYPVEGVFSQEVETRLPYTETYAKLPKEISSSPDTEFQGAMIDGERIIVMNSSAEAPVTVVDVLVF